MPDYVGLETTGHVLLEDGTGGLLLELDVAETVGRFCIAFNATTLEWDEAVFTRLDDPSLYPGVRVASYTIDRGRQYELDRTDTGRATVQINDQDGVLNPRNPDGPFYGQLRPLLQACINRYNPAAGVWRTRYRGYIEDLTYQFDPSQRVNRLTVTLVDQFEILAAVEMQPGRFGAGTDTDGQILFARARVNDRIKRVLNDTGIEKHARVVFSGNVVLQPQPYSAGESPMTVVQESADGELPGVSNVFCDRRGRLCFHGRFAKFNPDEVAAGASIGAWDFQRWNAGDGAAVHASIADTAQVRAFGFQHGLAKIINQATATPNNIDDADMAGQLVEDTASTAKYGIRSWSATNLVTLRSLIDGSDALTETRRFAEYYVANYAEPRDRILEIGFRALRPDDPRGPYLWKLLTEIDISDAVLVTVASPGGGGFEAESYFVEGVHETCQPLGDPLVDDVTLTLDLSPEAYYATNPWPDTEGPSVKVLKIDTVDADAWVELDFGTDQDEVWVSFDLYVPTAAFDLFSIGFSGNICSLFSAGHLGDEEDYVDIETSDFNHPAGSTTAVGIADEWVTVELHHVASEGLGELYLYDVESPILTGPTATANELRFGRLGLSNTATNDPASVIYIDNVKFGTNRGDDDLGGDGFEDGTLAAWTSTSGAASVVDDPT